MQTQRDPYQILADLIFDLCPREEIKNFRRSVFGREITIKEEFIHYFKISGFRPIEKYLTREALEKNPFWLCTFFREFTPEKPKFHNLSGFFRVGGREYVFRKKENPRSPSEEKFYYLEPIKREIKTPREAADIIFSVVPEEIMEKTVREVRGMTFSIKDEFTLYFNELEYLVRHFLTPEPIRKAALIIFSRGGFDFGNPNFSPFRCIFEYEDCLTYIDREDVVECTKSFREEGIETFRDVAKIALSVFTEGELKKHEETVDGRRITLEDKFTEKFEGFKFLELRLNEYLTRDYIVKTVLIKIYYGEFDIERPEPGVFFEAFFQPLQRFKCGVAEAKGLEKTTCPNW